MMMGLLGEPTCEEAGLQDEVDHQQHHEQLNYPKATWHVVCGRDPNCSSTKAKNARIRDRMDQSSLLNKLATSMRTVSPSSTPRHTLSRPSISYNCCNYRIYDYTLTQPFLTSRLVRSACRSFSTSCFFGI